MPSGWEIKHLGVGPSQCLWNGIDAQPCCERLGFEYVDDSNIGISRFSIDNLVTKEEVGVNRKYIVFFGSVLILVLIFGMVLYKKRKKNKV